MCSIDSKHSPSITLTSYFCKVFHPKLKSEYLFPHPLFPFPYANSYEVATSLKIINEKHACYDLKNRLLSIFPFDFGWQILFFHLDSHVFFKYIPKTPSNITGIFALHTPHFAKQQTCWFACFYTKIFYATKVPKSFKIFGTKPTFLLLNGTLSINFIRLSGRPSPLISSTTPLPLRDLFVYWVFCFFLHLFMNPVYNFQNKLPSDGMFNFHRIFQSR